MGHAVRIKNDAQYLAAIEVLNHVKGTWHGVGPSSDPVLLVTDEQYNALLNAGVVQENGKEVKNRGKKDAPKKARS